MMKRFDMIKCFSVLYFSDNKMYFLNPELRNYMQIRPYPILSIGLFSLVPSLSRSLKYNRNKIFI